MRNYYIFAAILIVFSIALIAASIRIVGTPFELKAKTLDEQRLSDFYEYARDIEYYYSTEKKLPPTLQDSQKSVVDESKNSLQDPETKKNYEYKIINGYTYKLCTEFSSDTTVEEKSVKNSNSYSVTPYLQYYTKDKKVTHKKGNDCFTFEIPRIYRSGADFIEPTSTPIPAPVVITKPAYRDRLCRGEEYTIEWTADADVTEVGLYLITPPEYKEEFENPYLINAEHLAPGEKVNPSDPKSKYKGTFTWTAGQVEYRGGFKIVPASNGYSLGAMDQDREISNTDYIVITDCIKAGVQDPI